MLNISYENNLIKAIENSNGLIMFSLDRNYCYQAFTRSHSETMKKIWNVDIHLGANMLDFLPLPDKAKAKANFDRALQGERFSIVEEYGDKKMFRSFWEDRYEPILDENGSITGFFVFVLDVSGMVRTTRALEDTQTTLRLALEATRTGIWEWLIHENKIFWSEQVYEIFGLNKNSGTVEFNNYMNQIHPADRKHVSDSILNALNNGSDYHIEHRVFRSDNSIRWVKGDGVVFYDVQGKPAKMLGTVQDITERKKAEQDRQSWQNRYDLIVKSSGQMIYDYDTTNGKIMWSGSTAEVLGFTAEEMGDISRWSELIHPEDKEQILFELERAEKAFSKFDVVYRFRNKEGYYKILSDRGFFFHDGEVVRMLGIMEDITREKEAEKNLIIKNEELTKANQELDRFVYSASHDLRAPIASLLGLIKVARLEKSIENIDTLLQLQEKTLQKLDLFIRDIVDYSRNSRTYIQSDPIDFRNLIEESFERLTFLENYKKLRREITVSQNAVFYSDINRIQIILNNLISNSIKYADLRKPDPFLTISVTVNTQDVVIAVTDNGEGIRPEYKDRIFEMFVRASDHSSGSGLGLYIVKEVVDKLNGKIEVHSELGMGTRFIILVPNNSGVQ